MNNGKNSIINIASTRALMSEAGDEVFNINNL